MSKACCASTSLHGLNSIAVYWTVNYPGWVQTLPLVPKSSFFHSIAIQVFAVLYFWNYSERLLPPRLYNHHPNICINSASHLFTFSFYTVNRTFTWQMFDTNIRIEFEMLGFIHIPEICFHPPDVLHEYGNMEMYTHRINWFLPYPHSLQNRARIAQIQQLYFCTQGSYLPSLCTPVAYTTKRESNYQNQPSVERF